MALERVVLVVSPTPSVAQVAAESARRCGYNPVVVGTFAEARDYLDLAPRLLVTELKLAEYNGLHLALRAGHNGIAAIVIADTAYQSEVEQLGATWASLSEVNAGRLRPVLQQLLPVETRVPLWSDAEIGTTPMHDANPPGPSILH